MTFESLKKKYFRFWDIEDSPADNTFDKYQKRLLPGEGVRRRGDRRPVEARFPRARTGRAASRRSSSTRRPRRPKGGSSWTTWSSSGGSSSTTTSTASCTSPQAIRVPPTRRRDPAGLRRLHPRLHGGCLLQRHAAGGRRSARPVTGFRLRRPVRAAHRGHLSPGATWARSARLDQRPDRPGRRFPPAGSRRRLRLQPHQPRERWTERSTRSSRGYVMPRDGSTCARASTRRFWLTVHVPRRRPAGRLPRADPRSAPSMAEPAAVPVEFRVYPRHARPGRHSRGALGPPTSASALVRRRPGHASLEQHAMAERSLREAPRLRLHHLQRAAHRPLPGLPRTASRSSTSARATGRWPLARRVRLHDAGGHLHGDFPGLNLYYRDEAAMQAAGYQRLQPLPPAVFTAIQQHAEAAGTGCRSTGTWATSRSATTSAAPPRTPRPTAPPSRKGRPGSPRPPASARPRPTIRTIAFAKALHVADLNGHDEESVSACCTTPAAIGPSTTAATAGPTASTSTRRPSSSA